MHQQYKGISFFCDPDKKRKVRFFQWRMHHFFCTLGTPVKRATKGLCHFGLRMIRLIYITYSWVSKPFTCNRKIEKSQENNSRIQRSLAGRSRVESPGNLAFLGDRPAEHDVTKPKQWTQQLGASSVDSGIDVTVDYSNNIYVDGVNLRRNCWEC